MAEENQNQQENRSKMPRRAFLGVGAAAVVGVILHSRYVAEPVEAKDTTPKDIRIVEFSDSGQRKGVVTVQTIIKTDAEWKQQLTPEAYDITRRAGTERPYTGKNWNNHDKGVYHCICCGTA